jgi:cell wall assembly regulator SMI1
MMSVTYSRREAPASDDAIGRLERHIGRALPDAYRGYLRQQDGGRLSNNSECVKHIFGIDGAVPEWANMWKRLDTYADRVPRWLLPVASDEFGNLFAISLREEDRGSVWFWDHEEEADEGAPPSEDNLEYKAPDWPTFLAGLEPLVD